MSKRIIITGASKGIGKALAVEFSAAGHSILAISRNEELLIDLQKLTNCTILPLDISALLNDSPAESFFSVLKDFGPVDILINNAGLLGKSDFTDYSLHLAMDVFNVNFFAPARLIQLLLPYFSESNPVHVVNISSMGGFQGSSKFPGLSYYSASKAALNTLAEVLAEEWKGSNKHINSLCLGSVQTEMLNEAFPGFQAMTSPAEMAKFIAGFALNGFQYFNGKTIPVSGTGI